MNNSKSSIYKTLAIVIFISVSIVMSIHSTYDYIQTKKQIISKMKNDSKATILSLKNNVKNLISSYSIHEYENLIFNEISEKNISAIIIEDYNMGKILAKKSYITGKIKDSHHNIVDYDSANINQQNKLDNAYFSDRYNIISENGKQIGVISIYISGEKINTSLNKIIFENIKNTIIMSLLLIFVLFICIRIFVLQPISDIINTINNSDKDGIPISNIPNSTTNEINSLSVTINKMIETIKQSRFILKENQEQLSQALKLQTTLFDNSGYIIIRTDKNGLIKQINKEAEKILGYKKDELIDICTPELIHLESEVIKKAQEYSVELKQELKAGFEVFVAKTNLGLDNEYEWTYKSKNGNTIPVLLSISALRNNKNEIYGYLGIAKDVTQRKLLESQSKLAAMGEMIGNIAHQWRQPLSVISTLASGVKIRSEFDSLDTEDMLLDMTHIIDQSQYLSDTIDDFRNFIKDTNKKEFFSISNTVEKTLSIVNSSLKSNGITVIVNIHNDISIEGFQNQLIQSFINIINNAKDAFNEKNIINKLLFIETKKTNNSFILTIKDNAGGIPEDVIPKVFEPYFTTKHQNVGTGIGLSMSHQIITEHHNATINVSNEEYIYDNTANTGASFKIEFTA